MPVESATSRLLRALVELDEGLWGYQITRLDHSLQSPSRAWRDGADIDWLVSALDEYAAAFIKPFVREQCTW